jgi:hypothetical protein
VAAALGQSMSHSVSAVWGLGATLPRVGQCALVDSAQPELEKNV